LGSADAPAIEPDEQAVFDALERDVSSPQHEAQTPALALDEEPPAATLDEQPALALEEEPAGSPVAEETTLTFDDEPPPPPVAEEPVLLVDDDAEAAVAEAPALAVEQQTAATLTEEPGLALDDEPATGQEAVRADAADERAMTPGAPEACALEPRESESTEVVLTEVVGDQELFEDPTIEVTRLDAGSGNEIIVPIEVAGEDGARQRFKLCIRLRLDPVE
jgi:hypothetical protein